jgi:hypothetical protein
MELKPEPSRPAVLATGIIDGMPECALACAAGMAPCRRTASQREGLPTALLRPGGWHRQHTDKGGLTHTRGDRGRACANAADA